MVTTVLWLWVIFIGSHAAVQKRIVVALALCNWNFISFTSKEVLHPIIIPVDIFLSVALLFHLWQSHTSYFQWCWVIWVTSSFIFTSGLPRWLHGKESACSVGAEDLGLIPGWGRSPGGRHGKSLQNSCLENPMDRGAWWVMIHVVTMSRTQLRTEHTCTFFTNLV